MEDKKEKPNRWHDNLFGCLMLIVVLLALVAFVRYEIVPRFQNKGPKPAEWDGRSLIQLKDEAERQKR